MSTDLSPQSEQYLAKVVERGVFPSRADALEQAIVLLRERAERASLDWTRSPNELLDRLEAGSTTDADRRTAILVAETMAFDETQRQRLLPALASFISAHRFASDEDTITILGSAIRKYAMNMDESHFGPYARWLQPSDTETLHHEVELELAKGASWRLTYEPARAEEGAVELTAALAGLANEYLSPRLILQKNYASITLHAVVGVAILEALAGPHHETEELLKRVEKLRVDWFSELLQRRIADACEAIEGHDPSLASTVRGIVVVGSNA
jgi:Arc/MetJ-type ribon-helix-helix transcriptional regulator